MNFFILNNELKSCCDFNPYLFENKKPVYEVVRVEKSIPLFFEDHVVRFFNSCNLAGYKCPVTEQQIKNRFKALIESNKLKTGLIKFISLKKEGAGVDILFAAWTAPFFFPSKHQYKTGVDLLTMKGERENPHAKFAQLSIRKQADTLIEQQKVYEVILINKRNIMTEGSRSNLFFVKKECQILFTPHHDFVLSGITRKKIIELALNLGIDVMESAFYLNELNDFDSLFLTGTSPKVMPVNRVDKLHFDLENDLVVLLKNEYDKLIDNYILHFSW